MILETLMVVSLFLTLLFAVQYRFTKYPHQPEAANGIKSVLTGTTIILFGLIQAFYPTWTTTRFAFGCFLLIIGSFEFINGYFKYRSSKEMVEQHLPS